MFLYDRSPVASHLLPPESSILRFRVANRPATSRSCTRPPATLAPSSLSAPLSLSESSTTRLRFRTRLLPPPPDRLPSPCRLRCSRRRRPRASRSPPITGTHLPALDSARVAELKQTTSAGVTRDPAASARLARRIGHPLLHSLTHTHAWLTSFSRGVPMDNFLHKLV